MDLPLPSPPLSDTLPAGALPLTGDDRALIAVARGVLLRHYRPFWHTIAAALQSRDGRIHTGLHLGATVGRLSVCAEPVALGRAILDGDGSVAAIVALRHPKPDESDRDIAIVPPCGACREMLLDFDPEAMVIVPSGAGAAKLPVRALLALPYRR